MEKRFIQLYSVKDAAFADFKGTLERLAKIGYTGVEFAMGYYGRYSAKELKDILAELNLEPISTHITHDKAIEHLDYAQELGIKYIIDPQAIFSTYEEALELAKKLNAVGEACAKRGIKFGYHNHRHEFLQGNDGYLLETLILNTNPEYVCFQLDVGWATCSGVDCPSFIKKHAGRFNLIHVKECAKVAGPEKARDLSKYRDADGNWNIPPEIIEEFKAQAAWNVAAGKGLIDWPTVVSAALEQGAQGFIVEREYDYAGDIFKCVEEDCAFLKTL